MPEEPKFFLHRSRVPLREADLRTEEEVRRDNGVFSLFDVVDEQAEAACGLECFV